MRDLFPFSMRFNMIIEWETPVIMVTLLLSGSGPEPVGSTHARRTYLCATYLSLSIFCTESRNRHGLL